MTLVALTDSQRSAVLAAVNGELESAEYHSEAGSNVPSPYHLDLEAARDALLAPVTAAELNVLVEALDSHVYWQLSDEVYRDSGYVQEPGSNDPDGAKMIAEANALHDRLAALVPPVLRGLHPVEDASCARCSKPYQDHPGGFCPDQVGSDGQVHVETVQAFVWPDDG